MNKLLLRDQDKTLILKLLADYLPNTIAWVYGSRVNGTAHAASDLDIVLRSVDLSPLDIFAVENFVQVLKDSSIPILIEARDWTRLPSSFQQEILKNYVVLN